MAGPLTSQGTRLLADTQVSRYRMDFARGVAVAGEGQYVRLEQLAADTLARVVRLGRLGR